MKIGVIGTGNWGKNLVRNFFELGVLTIVADPSEEARKNIKSNLTNVFEKVTLCDSHEEVLKSDVNAVAIASPVATHYKIAKEALEADKDVFLEKPMTLSLKEAEELVNLAEKKSKILMIGHILLYQPAIMWMKKYLDEGKLGTVYSFHQSRCNLGKARSVENVLWSLGVHDIAVLLYLAGESPKDIVVSGQKVLQKNIEDDVYLHMTFNSGKQAHLHNSWLWFDKSRNLTVVGSKGMLYYDEIAQSVVLHKKTIDDKLNNQDNGTEDVFRGDAQPLKMELEHFLTCIKERKTPVSSGRSGLDVIKVLEQATKTLEDK